MDDKLLEEWLRLRLTIGFLGEAPQFDWWPTKFYTDWSPTFLDPIFPKTAHIARYHGVTDAARRVHDTYIGVGSVFHLFRLPEEIERSLHSLAESGECIKIAQELSDKSVVLATLDGEKSASISHAEGPVHAGLMTQAFSRGGTRLISERYFNAFSNGVRTFPYLSGK
jgi:hypothetical protein